MKEIYPRSCHCESEEQIWKCVTASIGGSNEGARNACASLSFQYLSFPCSFRQKVFLIIVWVNPFWEISDLPFTSGWEIQNSLDVSVSSIKLFFLLLPIVANDNSANNIWLFQRITKLLEPKPIIQEEKNKDQVMDTFLESTKPNDAFWSSSLESDGPRKYPKASR